jgi:RimJ/RimL family protein N-acetyltransferase
MKDNATLKIRTQRVELVPYEVKFVERYHIWMQSPFLLDMTASEPLSIEEEYAMQKTWREDINKCTFIVLSKEEYSIPIDSVNNRDDEIARMIGDVNMFISKSVEKSEETIAELDIMIAEEAFRCKGYGREAVLMMIWYGFHSLKISHFFVKIQSNNRASIQLFLKLGFYEANYVAAFDEHEYTVNVLTNEIIQTYLQEISERICLSSYP